MKRRWLALFTAVLVGIAAGWYWLPELVRRVAISQIQGATRRTATIEQVEVNPFTGRLRVRGFRLTEPDGTTPFAEFRDLEARVRLTSLLAGHLWIRELALRDSTVRVVRLAADRFNISDLIDGTQPSGKRLDVTVERFDLTGGTVTLDDRVAREPQTWASEQITIAARNVSTRRNDGSAVATSVTAGAPARLEVRNLRLHPIHAEATLRADGLDLTLARVPAFTADVRGFVVRDGALRLDRLTAEGTMSVREPTGKRGGPLRLDTVKASIADLTWPATTPGRLDVRTSIPGGGTLTLGGLVQPPPARSDLRLRVTGFDLAPWAWLLAINGDVSGVAEADLRVNEPIQPGLPTRVQGSIAVNRPVLGDGRRHVAGARRVEASGLELHGPARLVVKTVTVTSPRGVVERDRAGTFSATTLVARPSAGVSAPPRETATPLEVEVGRLVVRDGAVAWRDHSVSPPARLEVSAVDATITGLGWPLRGPADVRVSLRPPGGGQLRATGRVALQQPLHGTARVVASNADLAPYQPYVPTPARIAGTVDMDLAVDVPSLPESRAAARGTVVLSRLDVQDRQRTLLRAERVAATGVDVDWPGRITVARVDLAQPWGVLERDDKGAFPLRELLMPSPAPSNGQPTVDGDAATPLAVTVSEVRVDRGGLRIVDRAVSPAFAVDFQPVTMRVNGLTTAPDSKPARVEMSGQLGPGAVLALRGTVGALGGPLRLDVNGELREFALPRTNPYVLQHTGWKTVDGRLSTRLRCRIDGDALSARTDIRVSRLEVLRAAAEDGAEARLGLPLRMLTSLLKDRNGDITLSLPIGGRVTDPRFDFSEVIWSAIRTVAVNAITLPVRWIGRVRVTSDSRIERIDVDPIPFEPGISALSAAGEAQAARLAAFFGELPEARMTMTPVVSPQDAFALRRRVVEGQLERLARTESLSPADAAARLWEQRFGRRAAPGTPDAIVHELAETEPLSPSALAELTSQRADAVRAHLRQSGVDPERLAEKRPVEGDGSRVALEIAEPSTPRPSKTREILRRIGLPVRTDATE